MSDKKDKKDKKNKKDRKMFRFSAKDNVNLLKHVIELNPLSAPHGQTAQCWSSVADGFNKIATRERGYPIEVTAATLTSHFKGLEKAFRAQESDSYRKSGVEEEYDEIDALLTDIVQIIDDKALIKKERKEEDAKKVEAAKFVPDSALKGLVKTPASGSILIDDDMSSTTSKSAQKGNLEDVFFRNQAYGIELINKENEATADYRKRKSEFMEQDLILRRQELELRKKEQESKDKKDEQLINLLAVLAEKLK